MTIIYKKKHFQQSNKTVHCTPYPLKKKKIPQLHSGFEFMSR